MIGHLIGWRSSSEAALINEPRAHVLGRNHVNETARHGIVAHRLWGENLGNLTEVILTDSFGFVAEVFSFVSQTLSQNSNPKLILSEIAFGQRN